MDPKVAKAACDQIYTALGLLQDGFASDPTNGPLVAQLQTDFAPLNANVQAAFEASGAPGNAA